MWSFSSFLVPHMQSLQCLQSFCLSTQSSLPHVRVGTNIKWRTHIFATSLLTRLFTFLIIFSSTEDVKSLAADHILLFNSSLIILKSIYALMLTPRYVKVCINYKHVPHSIPFSISDLGNTISLDLFRLTTTFPTVWSST